MDDCEIFGGKHHLKFDHAVDQWLVGQLWFKCRNCSSVVMVDRFYFYLAITSEVRRGS